VHLVPLTYEQHGALRLRPYSDYRFAQDAAVISLLGSETPRAAHEFPIAFTAEPEGYFPAALLGVEPGRNAFVDAQGRWLAGYLPALWRRSAFRLARLEGKEDWVLCIDRDSPWLDPGEGQPLFDESGNPAKLIQQVMQFLGQLEADRQVTIAACAAIDRQGLIVPWELKIDRQDGTVQRIDGLFRVDEAKLRGLSGEALADLQHFQALPLVYAHLFSLQKMPLLGRLAAERAAERQQREILQEGKLDLDRLFGIVEDDPFIF
jgi:hypothetical protein